MTNDLTTVAGSFQQLIDDLENNLQEKGVDVEYDATTGIRGLVAKILDIECNSSSGNVVARVIGNNVSLGKDSSWLITTDDVVIDWGDGTSDIVNNPYAKLSHTYTDGLNEHLIIFDGTVTSLGSGCFYECSGLTSIAIPDSVTSIEAYCFEGCSNLTSIAIPDSVTSLRGYCFYRCSSLTFIIIPNSVLSIENQCFYSSSLTSIVIPNSVTSLGAQCFYKSSSLTSVTIPDSVNSIGRWCFKYCSNLIDYQLYWETSPITYDSDKMPMNTDTVFTIPYGTTSIYVDAGYPSDRLVERENLVLSSTTPIIQKEDTATINAVLTLDDVPISGETLNYVIKHNNSVLNRGSVVTSSDGTASIRYVGTGVGDVSVKVSYGTLLQETFVIEDTNYYDVSSQSNLSNYSIGSDVSFGYDSSNSAYLIYPTSVGTKFVTLNNKSFNKDNKISIDFNITSSQNNAQIGFVLGNLGVRCIYAGQQTLRIYRISISNSALNNDYTYRDCNVNFNTWYTLELLPTGVLNLKQGNTIVATCNYDISSLLSDNNSLKLYIGFDTDTRILLRNIKVKAL